MAVECGVDQITLVVRPNQSNPTNPNGGERPPGDLDLLRRDLVVATGLEDVFGALTDGTEGGRKRKFLFERYSKSEFAMISDTPTSPDQGLLLHMSAGALTRWCASTGGTVLDFLDSAGAVEGCEVRVTRIDPRIDFVDEGIDLDELEGDLVSGAVVLTRLQRSSVGQGNAERRWETEPLAVRSGGSCKTIYFGKERKRPNLLVRLYDKKLEQLETNGPELDRALSCRDWVRLEMVLRRQRARQFGDALGGCSTGGDVASLVTRAVIQTARFKVVEDGRDRGLVPWLDAIASPRDGGDLVFTSTSTSGFDLEDSVLRLGKSGLFSTLCKVALTFGDDGPGQVMDFVWTAFTDYEPTPKVLRWADARSGAYRSAYGDVGAFLEGVRRRARSRRVAGTQTGATGLAPSPSGGE